jgi:hypothetical protein
MSRQNKVNPDHYTTAGRLSPDDLARERWKQNEPTHAERGRRARKAMPPWMSSQAGNKPVAIRGEADDDQTEAQEKETSRLDEPKKSGAAGTPQTRKAPRARGSATRAASPQRAGKPGARQTASRGRQKSTPKKGARRTAATSNAAAGGGTKRRAAKKGAAKKAAKKGAAKKKRSA